MAKISLLDPIAPDGTETVVVLKGGVAKRASIGGLVSAAVSTLIAGVTTTLNGLVSTAQGAATAAGQSADAAAASRQQLTSSLSQDGAASTITYRGSQTIGAALDKLLYSGIRITALSVAPAQAELGSTVATVTVSWTVAGSVTSQTLKGVAVAAGDRAKTFANVSATTQYDLAVTDANAPGGAAGDAAQASTTFLPRRFWGASASAELVGADVIALSGSELTSARAKNFSVMAAGQYVYLAYLAPQGDPNVFKIGGFSEQYVKTTVSVTTAAGLTANYTVLRSLNKLTGAVSVEVQ